MSSTYSVPQRRKQSPCRFRNLSRAEIETICNGCGGWFDPPDYNFTASCNHHDFNYWLGGTEADRKKADDEFLVAMLADARSFNDGPAFLRPVRRWWRQGAAYRYWLAVRVAGKKFFHYTAGKPEGKLLEKTRWMRLERLMKVHGHEVASEFTAKEEEA